MSDAIAQIFDELCRVHGPLGPLDAAIARRVAALLAAEGEDVDQVRAAEAATKLRSLLPTRPRKPPPDLTVLSDAELEQLAAILAKASGIDLPPLTALP